jgi:hypothetical protein
VLQQTPLAVTVADPDEVTLPPQFAVEVVIFDTEDVLTVGIPEVTVTITKEDVPSFPASSNALANSVCCCSSA